VKHNKEKEFWERALVLISRTNSLTQTHALFLEWHCLQSIRSAGRFIDENGNGGSRPHTPAPMEADCHEIFDTGRALLATLGYPLFDSVAKSSSSQSGAEEIFLCKASGIDARGRYTSEGFVVLAGSTGRKESVTSILGTSDHQMRLKLIDAGILKIEGDTILVTKDHLFRSPSTAAVALLGRTANGWKEWKSPEGKTLDTLKRQAPQG